MITKALGGDGLLFIYLTLGLWSILFTFWLVAARISSQTSFSSEIFAFFKLISSGLMIYLPLLLGGVLATRIFPNTLWLEITGNFITAAGVWLAIWSRITLGKNWSGKVMLQREHQLVVSGPYRLVRHPIYLGGLLAMVGTCLVVGQIFGVAYVVLSIVGLAKKSKQEETLLVKQFPDEYPQYKRQVKMLIPYLY